MDKARLLAFLRTQTFAVQSSVSADGGPQSAVVGFVVSDEFEVFFDTVDTSRKVKNLRGNRKIGFVIGGLTSGDERTVQYEGVADEPSGSELERLKQLYFARFPDGPKRQTWPGLMYVRARPTWIRFSDYNQDPPLIVEYSASPLERT